jgi:Ca-activated chloride channel family protein
MNKLVGKDDSRVKEVTELGLKYNLMTEFTSFVAVDTVVRADGAKSRTVRQPLPLPQGVSDMAVGGSVGGKRCKKKPSRGRYSYSPPATAPVMAEKPAKEEEKRISRLSNADIVRVMRRNVSGLKTCCKKHVKAGKIVLEITVGKSGRVTGLKIVSGAANNSKLKKCLLRILRRMQFPRSGSSRTFKFPLVVR